MYGMPTIHWLLYIQSRLQCMHFSAYKVQTLLVSHGMKAADHKQNKWTNQPTTKHAVYYIYPLCRHEDLYLYPVCGQLAQPLVDYRSLQVGLGWGKHKIMERQWVLCMCKAQKVWHNFVPFNVLGAKILIRPWPEQPEWLPCLAGRGLGSRVEFTHADILDLYSENA